MEYRQLGGSGLRIPVLTFGTMNFGDSEWGKVKDEEARKMVHLCLDKGLNLFDTADAYSRGLSEEMLGRVIKGKRNEVLISTKMTCPMGEGPNDYGASRFRIIRGCEESLQRLQTDHIDIYTIHTFDATTPVEETLRALDDLIQSGKARYIAASNFSSWHLMKSLGIADQHGWNRYVAHQVHYSLLNRDYEWELMPLALDQQIGALVWSPLNRGRLTGRYTRSNPIPKDSDLAREGIEGPAYTDDYLYGIIDTLQEIANETGKTIAQVSLNWLLQRPSVSSIIIGSTSLMQLQQNLGAIGWNLTEEQVKRLDEASRTFPPYPYYLQEDMSFFRTRPDFYRHLSVRPQE